MIETGAAWRRSAGLKLADLASANVGRFATSVIAARLLDAESFGFYSTVLIVGLSCAALLNLGVPTALAKAGAEAMATGRSPETAVRWAIRNRVGFAAFGSLLAAGIVAARPGVTEADVLIAASGLVVAQMFTTLLEYALSGLGRHYWVVTRAGSSRELVRAFTLLLFVLQPSVLGVLLAEIAPLVMYVGVASSGLRRALALSPEARLDPDPNRCRDFARRAAPSSVASLGVDWLPPVMVALVGSTIDVGQFSVAWRWNGLLPTLLPFAGVALVAPFARLSDQDQRRFVADVSRQALVIPLLVAALLGMLSVVAVPRVFGPEFDQAGLLALSLVFAACCRVINPFLRQVVLLRGHFAVATQAPAIGAALTFASSMVLSSVFAVAPPSAVALGVTVGSAVELAIVARACSADGIRGFGAILAWLGGGCLLLSLAASLYLL